MSVFGIVVEGPYDSAVYSILIPRIRHDVELVVKRPCGGVAALRRKFVGFLKEFQYPIVKALVIRDSDRRDPLEAEDELSRILKDSGFRSIPVHVYATMRALETWLMADEEAVMKVARNRGTSIKVKPIEALEQLPEPKSEFYRMLSQAGLPATEQVYKEIASAVDLARIEQRCPRFEQFCKGVHAC